MDFDHYPLLTTHYSPFTMLLLTIALISIFTFALFGWDKACAKAGRARVPEAVLLGCALIGGTPGAFLGMRHFRHKTAKLSFQVKFWLIVALQVWLCMFAPDSLQRRALHVIGLVMG